MKCNYLVNTVISIALSENHLIAASLPRSARLAFPERGLIIYSSVAYFDQKVISGLLIARRIPDAKPLIQIGTSHDRALL